MDQSERRWKIGGALGLRTLNQRVHEVSKGIPSWKDRELSLFPPVVRMDGIWVTLLKQTGARKKDLLGRNRLVKEGHRVVVLVAQGVWPTSGRQEVLTWLVAEGETEQAWKDLLFQVQQMQLSSNGHIELLVGDGSTGFEAARQVYYPNVPFQRCIFHKLRNVGRDLEPPVGMDQKAGREYRRGILVEAAQIWQSPDELQAQKAFLAFCDKWETTQPKAIHTLQRQFDLTLSFYRVQYQAKCQGEIWPASLLRTTSQLERENRNFRRRFRQAVSFHSQVGLEAAFFQNIALRNSLADPALSNRWPALLEKEIAHASNFMS